MTTVLVTGGSGILGSELLTRLVERGYTVRILSRRGPKPDTVSVSTHREWVQGNLASGQGLTEAVAGIDTIVHAATDPNCSHQIDIEGTRILLARAREAGVSHFVYISIVGTDLIPYPYYVSKLAAEKLIKQSGIPWSLLRATQFHTLIDTFLQIATKPPLLALLPIGFQAQPVDAGDVADHISDLVTAGPSRRVPDLGGPETLTSKELLYSWLSVREMHRLIIPLWLPGKAAHGFRCGYNTCALEPWHGTITWNTWLRKTYQKQSV